VVVLKFCGKIVDDEQIKLIQELSEDFWGISRTELASTVCELLSWNRPNGTLKTVECRQFLEEMAEHSLIRLPVPRRRKPKGSKTRTQRTARGEEGPTLIGSLKNVKPVELVLVESVEDRELWKELVDRYHYLGFKVPFGACLRYLIKVREPKERVVGCLQFSSPAWRVGVRDAWIGWNESLREERLQSVVQNSRFLILPWCKVRYLASHVLSMAVARLALDWEKAFNVSPVLLETFVDHDRFKGTCYRAANWTYLGETQGRGRMDHKHEHLTSKKGVWVYPLMPSFRRVLGTSA
jgi:hypothetical protein